MATRSLIGMTKPDSTVDYIYCHWDGYPEHHLPILEGFYTDEDTVAQLLSLGYLSSLAENISAPEGSEHTFEKPLNDVCIFYHRDRGESKEHSKTRNVSYDEYSKPSFGDSCWAEYKYLFQDGEWQVFEVEMEEEATA
jgi:hypothetical protein